MNDVAVIGIACLNFTTAGMFAWAALNGSMHQLSLFYRAALALIGIALVASAFHVIDRWSLSDMSQFRIAKDVGLFALGFETLRHWNPVDQCWRGPKPPRQHRKRKAKP